MAPGHLPLRPDGLFEWRVRIKDVSTSRPEIERWFHEWLAKWGVLYDDWDKKHARFEDEYVQAPIVETLENGVLTLLLIGRPGGEHWKYFAVRMTSEFVAAHPGAERIREYPRGRGGDG